MLAPDAFVRILSALGPRWVRFRTINCIATAQDGPDLVAWIGGEFHVIAGNPPSVDAELRRLADDVSARPPSVLAARWTAGETPLGATASA